jgi:hypothetical protein
LSHLGDFQRSFSQRLFALFVFRYVEKEAGFLQIRFMLLPRADDSSEGGLFFEDALSLFAVVPKFRLRGELI